MLQPVDLKEFHSADSKAPAKGKVRMKRVLCPFAALKRRPAQEHGTFLTNFLSSRPFPMT